MTAARPFGTPATRLHGGRIALVLVTLLVVAFGAWAWAFRKGAAPAKAVTESSAIPGWTAAQMHYDKPEVKAEVPPPAPVDTVSPELARLRAMLAAMQAQIDELANRKTPAATVTKDTAKPAAPPRAPAPLLFVSHDLKEGPPTPKTAEYTLAPGSTKIPCVVETKINSDVPGHFTSKVSTNIYDTATGRHLLIPQGSTILGHDQSQDLLYGNERLPTIGLTLALPDGRSVDLGQAPVTDQQGVAGLTGDVNNHWGRLLGAVFIGGALRGGQQAIQAGVAQAGGIGQVASGIASTSTQVTQQRLGRALDTRPTITVDAGQLCNVILVRPLSLPAMWE